MAIKHLLYKDYFLIGTDEGVKKTIDTLSGGASLTQDKGYKRVMAKLPSGNSVVYGSLSKLVKRVVGEIKEVPPSVKEKVEGLVLVPSGAGAVSTVGSKGLVETRAFWDREDLKVLSVLIQMR
ncbi:MAG TPA: hypothetical protein EYP78_02885 [Candidatus Omnitrophica bacterium]|nr:hypothetical protein [Candidatus Omnitrophota bacterium]